MPPKAPATASQARVNRQSSHDDGPTIRNGLGRIFSVPRPIAALFDAVPLITYSANELPERTLRENKLPSLYVFITEEDAKAGRPSYNPGCLKWQTALRIASLPVRLISSNNHASPTGSLPFLLPPSSPSSTTSPLPIPSAKLLKHAASQKQPIPEPTASKYAAYQSLLENSIRPAWLHSLYLSKGNRHIAEKLYIHPVTSTSIVRASIEYTLKRAAHTQLLLASRDGQTVDVDDVYASAALALEAFALLLEEEEWLLGGDGKGGAALLDAGLFAYTQLLLDEKMGWKDRRLVKAVLARPKLVAHRERMLQRYWR